MKTPEDIRIEIRSDPRLLKAVRGLVRGYMAHHGFDTARVDEIVIAVDEACANALRHSYQGRTDGVLKLALCSNPRSVRVTLQDEGIPAQLPRKRAKKTDEEVLKPGGKGLEIMRAVFDEVKFQVGKEHGNCVTMRLKRPD